MYHIVISAEYEQWNREEKKEDCCRDECGNTTTMGRKRDYAPEKADDAFWNGSQYRHCSGKEWQRKHDTGD